jgi:hypothetical protein
LWLSCKGRLGDRTHDQPRLHAAVTASAKLRTADSERAGLLRREVDRHGLAAGRSAHVQAQCFHLKSVRGVHRHDVQPNRLAKPDLDACRRERVPGKRDVDGPDRVCCLRLDGDKEKRQEEPHTPPNRRTTSDIPRQLARWRSVRRAMTSIDAAQGSGFALRISQRLLGDVWELGLGSWEL